MFNDRPIESKEIRDALIGAKYLFDTYDLAGGIFLINYAEWAYGYQMPTSWNAHVNDSNMPMGFRIRARQEELGSERAKQLIEGSAFCLTSMQDFGNQTRLWAGDMIKMLKKVGLHIDYKPFNGKPLPRIYGVDMR